MPKDFSNDPDMQKLTTRMIQLNRQFSDLFERCFERPDLAFEKWTSSSLNDGHSYEILKYQLFSLGEMPRTEARKEDAIDASLRIADVFQEYRGLRDRLDEMRAIDPDHFKGMQRQIRADPAPWWVSRKPGDSPSEGHEQERDLSRDWWRDR